MAAAESTADPVLEKMRQARKLLRQAHNELGDRLADTRRTIARMHLGQAVQKVDDAIRFEETV